MAKKKTNSQKNKVQESVRRNNNEGSIFQRKSGYPTDSWTSF